MDRSSLGTGGEPLQLEQTVLAVTDVERLQGCEQGLCRRKMNGPGVHDQFIVDVHAERIAILIVKNRLDFHLVFVGLVHDAERVETRLGHE